MEDQKETAQCRKFNARISTPALLPAAHFSQTKEAPSGKFEMVSTYPLIECYIPSNLPLTPVCSSITLPLFSAKRCTSFHRYIFSTQNEKANTTKSSFAMSDYLHTPLVIVVIVLSAIATLTVALRIWARKIQKLRLELNDYCIVAGLVGEPLIVEICLTPIRSSH